MKRQDNEMNFRSNKFYFLALYLGEWMINSSALEHFLPTLWVRVQEHLVGLAVPQMSTTQIQHGLCVKDC